MDDQNKSQKFEIVFKKLSELVLDDVEAVRGITSEVESTSLVIEELRSLSELRENFVREEYYTGT